MLDRTHDDITRDLGAGWDLVQHDWTARQREPELPRGPIGCLEAAFVQLRRIACLVFRCGAVMAAPGTRR